MPKLSANEIKEILKTDSSEVPAKFRAGFESMQRLLKQGNINFKELANETNALGEKIKKARKRGRKALKESLKKYGGKETKGKLNDKMYRKRKKGVIYLTPFKKGA